MEAKALRRVKVLAAGLALGAVSALAVTGCPGGGDPAGGAGPDKRRTALEMPPRLFHGWARPDLALVVSAEQHGYLLPCGCSRPQVGGLERRYNLLQILRDKGWPVAAVDLGDIAQRQGPRKLPNVQGLLKYHYSMKALRQMNYLAVGLGEYEASLSLFDVLGEYALNNPEPPVLAANLHNKETLYPGQVHSRVVKPIAGTSLKVGVVSTIGPSVDKKLKDQNFKVKLDDNRVVIPKVLREMAREKPDLLVLLYQGTLAEAKALAAAHKEFNVIVCLSPEDEPSYEPVRVGDTLIACPGHKGRYVAVVGVYATAKPGRPFDFRYQVVSLGEEFMTPKAEEKGHPIVAMLEEYTKELKDQDYLAKYPQVRHPIQVAIKGKVPKYVGSERCARCHAHAYEVWKKSKHAHAFEALEHATRPSLRKFDAECVVCHTVGFGYESGYKNERDTPLLKHVGCESCHGPAGEHIKDPRNKDWHKLMNPWRPEENETDTEKKKRMLRIDQFCYGCHDTDNDVHYKFEKRWPPVEHSLYDE